MFRVPVTLTPPRSPSAPFFPGIIASPSFLTSGLDWSRRKAASSRWGTSGTRLRPTSGPGPSRRSPPRSPRPGPTRRPGACPLVTGGGGRDCPSSRGFPCTTRAPPVRRVSRPSRPLRSWPRARHASRVDKAGVFRTPNPRFGL